MYFDEEVMRLVDGNIVPGISYAIVEKYSKYFFTYGYKALVPQRIPLSDTNLYDLASLSKVVATTTAILILIDRGCLSLDTCIKEVLPEFIHEKVTVFNLLTHTSGLPSDISDKYSLNKQELTQRCFTEPLEYSTGTKVEYSDIGFILLGIIIERITGSLENFVNENILLPLNMTSTGYNPANKDICVPTEATSSRGIIQGYVHDTKGFILGGAAGSAGLFSTIGDLARFASMMLNYGNNNGRIILKEATIKSLYQCHTIGLNLPRSLGWSIYEHNNKQYLYHTGFTGPSMLLDFEANRALILLTNRIHPSRSNTAYLDERPKLFNWFLDNRQI